MSAHESKPEWFQLADEDWAASPQGIDTRSTNVRRKNPIRLMAISTPLLVLAAGLFVAQTQQTPEAFAASTQTVAAAPVAPVSPITSAPTISTPSASSALATLQSGLSLPAKGTIQSGDDGDDEGQDD